MSEMSFNSEKERDNKVDELKSKGVNVYAVGYSPFTYSYFLYYTEENNGRN